jgi:hypothetical protein
MRFFERGSKKYEDLYWDKNEDAFTDTDPTPEVRAERARVVKEREEADALAASDKSDKQKVEPLSEQEQEKKLWERKEALREQIEALSVSEEKKSAYIDEIDAADDAREVNALQEKIRREDAKFQKKQSSPSTQQKAERLARTVKTPGVMSAEEIVKMQQVVASMNETSEAAAKAKAEKESIDKLRGRLKGRIHALSGKDNEQKNYHFKSLADAKDVASLGAIEQRIDEIERGAPANPEAALTSIGKSDTERVFVESGDTLFVKDGRAVRQATAEEVVEHAARKKAEIEARAAQLAAGASPKRPADALGQPVPRRLSRLEGLYEMQGRSPEDFLAGLEATAKKRTTGSGVPRMRQTEEVREVEERIPLSELLGTHRSEFEGITAMTQRQILTDAEGEILFPELLLKLDPESGHLIEKSVAGAPLTEYESKLLHYARYEYTRRMNQVAALRTWMKPADLEIVARKNEDFDRVMGLNGADRTTELLKIHIARMGIANPEALNRLHNVYSRLATLRDSREYRKWADDIFDLCKESGVNPDDFGVVFDTGSPEKLQASRRVLADTYHTELSGGLRILDSVIPFTKMKAAWKVGRARRLSRQMNEGAGGAPEEVGMQLRNLAKMLRYTVTDEQEVVQLLEREAFQNKSIPHPSERGVHSYGAVEKAGKVSDKAIDEKLQTHMKNFKDEKGLDWAHTSRAKREESLRPLRNSLFESQAAEAGTSWFSRALNGLFEMLLDSKFKQAITMPHAV